jgi:hypothetical protein
MIRFLVQGILILVVFIAAWRTGEKPERYVATIYLAMLFASGANALLAESDTYAVYQGLHLFHFVLDVSAMVGILAVALRYDRWWTLWVGSAQFIAVMAHLLRASGMEVPPMAYAVMERWPIWIAVLMTGLGTFLHHRRCRETANVT